VLTVPSASIVKDVECLRALCPSRFRLATSNSNNNITGSHHESQQLLVLAGTTTAVLVDKNTGITLVLVAVPVAAAHRIVTNRSTFVLSPTELKGLVKRSQPFRLVVKTVPPQETCTMRKSPKSSNYEELPEIPLEMAELNLPGGAGFSLVSEDVIKNNHLTGHYELGQRLADSFLQSLPKGITRSLSSGRNLPERRQSFGDIARTASSSSCSSSRGRSSTPARRQLPSPQPRRTQSITGGSRSSLRTRSVPRNPCCCPPSPTIHKSTSSKKPFLKRNSYHNTNSPNSFNYSSSNNNGQNSSNNHNQTLISPISKEPIPSFPTLKFSSLYLNGKYRHDFMANSHAPIPIETELFVGHMVFLLRPECTSQFSDMTDNIFAQSNRRRVVIQLQGKFKYEPQGPVFAGIEASPPLHVGRLSKALCGLLFRWAQANNQRLYSSFGSINGADPSLQENPKMVVPAHTFFDRIVVTPPNEIPPLLGNPLEESEVSIDYRKKQSPGNIQATHQAQWTWNVKDTYSMSICTSNLDLPSWSLLNVPQLQAATLKLSHLVGNSALRFVMYENTTPKRMETTGHLQQFLRYHFVIQCKYAADKENEHQAPIESGTLLDWVAAAPIYPSSNDIEPEVLQLEKTESDKFPAEEIPRDEVDSDYFLKQDNGNAKTQKGANSTKINDSRNPHTRDAFNCLAKIDRLCPAWIEMCAPQGKYTRAYAFNVNNRTVFRTPQSFRDLVNVKNYSTQKVTKIMLDKLCSPRMADAERMRREFGKILECAFSGDNAHNLKQMMEIYGSQFLRRRETSWPEQQKSSDETSGIVARALSDRHWVEEWAEITKKSIKFAHPETKKVHFAIQMDCVLCLRCVEEDEAPLIHGYYFMAVETLGRTTYVMFATEDNRRECFTAISKFLSSDSVLPLYLNTPRNEFLIQSSMWNCGKRLIMNGRQMSFRTPFPAEQVDAVELVEQALGLAFDEETEYNDDKLQAFLDRVSKFKNVSVSGLKEEHRIAFFLNLYHVMIKHMSLILGAMNSPQALTKNFNSLSYICCDDIFTIAELEYCIIRAPMTPLPASVQVTNPQVPPPINSRLLKATSPLTKIPPKIFKFSVPISNYSCALRKADYRINFALNWGTKSNLAEIPIYKADLLDSQLHRVSRNYLNTKVAITERNSQHVCILPRVCQWYADDFGETNYAVLKTLEPNLGQDEQKILHSSDFASFPIVIKYLPFNFESHRLTLNTRILLPEGVEHYDLTGPKYFVEEDDMMSIHSTTHSSTHSSSGGSGGPLSVMDAPPADGDMDDLLEFLMDDSLQI